MIHIIIADDHAIVRSGIRALLEKVEEVHILGVAADGEEVIQLAEKLMPDVIVMDIMMPRLNGIQTAEKLRAMKIPSRVVLLSMYFDEVLVHQALQYGVKGYVLKTSLSEELIRAVRAAFRGDSYLSEMVSGVMVKRLNNPQEMDSNDPLSMLSPREKEILKLIAEGHTSSEIAGMLFISEKTIEKHRAHLMEKLDIHRLAGLVRFAIKHRLID